MGIAPSAAVLVVHGSAEARAPIFALVQELGYGVEQATDGASAVRAVEGHDVSVILYQLNPTELAGLGAFARVRELPGGKGLAIIAMCRREDLPSAKRFGKALDIEEYVTEPIDGGTLATLLERLYPKKPAEDPTQRRRPSGQVTLDELRDVHQRLGKQSFFDRLEVGSDEGPVAVRQKYLALVKRYSPDSVGGTEARRLLRDIYDALGEAYKVLRDDEKRQEYAFRLKREQKAAATSAAASPPAPAAAPEPKPAPKRVEVPGMSSRGLQPPTTQAPPASPVAEPGPPAAEVPLFADALDALDAVEQAAPPEPPAEPDLPEPQEAAPQWEEPSWPEPGEEEAPVEDPAPEDPAQPWETAPELAGVDSAPPLDATPDADVSSFDEADDLFSAAPPSWSSPEPVGEASPDTEEEVPSVQWARVEGSGDEAESSVSDSAAPATGAATQEEPEEDVDIWSRGGALRETHEELAAAAHLQAVMGDYDGAVELLQQCLLLKPNDPDYKYQFELNQARRYRKLGNGGRARHHFEAAVKSARPGVKAAQEELDELLGGGGPQKKGKLSSLFSRKRRK